LRGEQIRDFVIPETGFPQDLAGMLTQSGRRTTRGAVSLAEPRRRPNHPDAPFGRMLGWREHVDCGEVLVGRQLGERVDPPARDVG
jgi:hypothetical protein